MFRLDNHKNDVQFGYTIKSWFRLCGNPCFLQWLACLFAGLMVMSSNSLHNVDFFSVTWGPRTIQPKIGAGKCYG